MHTKELNIKILETAGYTVNLYDNTFSMWEGGLKLLGTSNRHLDNEQFATDYIRSQGFKEGYQAGQRDLKNSLKDLLGV